MTGILTLRLDAASQSHFESMRQRYFPPDRNLIPAHLTLFHTLPMTEQTSATLAGIASATPAFALTVTGLRSLGRGVAYTLAGPEILALHRGLSLPFAAHLTQQDRQKFQPHVVIQNKATAEQARALLVALQPGFAPFSVAAHGVDLWQYRDGPWELDRQFNFSG